MGTIELFLKSPFVSFSSAVQATRKKETQDETQFTTKIGGKN
jgi:hypothetical protein